MTRARPLRSWHRRIGITTAVLLCLFVVSGITLQHQGQLGLERRFVHWTPLLDLYGIRAPAAVGYPVGGTWVTALGERLYLDETAVDVIDESPVGAVRQSGAVVVATSRDLLILTPEGGLIERRTTPARTTRVGLEGEGAAARAVLETDTGPLVADADLLAFEPLAGGTGVLSWSAAGDPPEALLRRLETDYRRNVLSVTQLLRDVHSGRLFGSAGVYVADAAGVALLVLAATGLFLAPRRARRSTEQDRR